MMPQHVQSKWSDIIQMVRIQIEYSLSSPRLKEDRAKYRKANVVHQGYGVSAGSRGEMEMKRE